MATTTRIKIVPDAPKCQLCTTDMEIIGRQAGRLKYSCPVCSKYEKFACALCRRKFSLWSDYHSHQQSCKPINQKYLPIKRTGRTKEEIVNAVEFFIQKDHPNAIFGYGQWDFSDVREEEWEILQYKYKQGVTV